MEPRVYVIHENPEWVVPLRAAFERAHVPFDEWNLGEGGTIALDAAPPEGVFYNRMSASSHTRDHRYAAEYTGTVLEWLERHGRRTVNSRRALTLEISKAAQDTALRSAGIQTPKTSVAYGKAAVREAARAFALPFVLKHNRGGKGLGVRGFSSLAELDAYLESEAYEAPVDGIELVQQYVKPADDTILRAEFVGGRFLYAVRVDTSRGFQLCPADACEIPGVATRPPFEITHDVDRTLIASYERFLAANGIDVAGIESVTDAAGNTYTYDVNTNTNYNSDAERRAGVSAMDALAVYLRGELERLYAAAA